MTTSYQVKGSTVRSKLDFVGDRFGAAARTELEKQFARRGLFPLLTASWYPYDLFVELLEAIAERHYGGDLGRLREVGEASAQAALSSVYEAFVRDGGFRDFLAGIAQLHHLFYNLGRIEVAVADDGAGCAILHRDKPRYAEADLEVAAGFYKRAAELHGLTGIECSFEMSADGADFRLTWSS